MGFLRDFGSRNHPEVKARKARMQKARAGMAVTPETVAKYRAARAFSNAEVAGSLLMVLSFLLLYLLTAASRWTGPRILATCIAVLLVGTTLFWRARVNYTRVDFPYRRRADIVALLLAGSAGVFWLLFAVLEVLAYNHIRVM